MKINKRKIWQTLTQLTLTCLKYMKGMFIFNVTWHKLFLDTLAVILRKKSEIVGEIFSPALEMQFVQFY